jgi:ubiquinone/menaquinone biosynthesis C-methylase UbiE
MTNTAEYLNRQYGNAGNLNARIALHNRFSTNPQGWMPWVYERLALQAGSRVLEVGCGTGLLWQYALTKPIPAGCDITLSDASPGMLQTARANLAGQYPGFRFEVADAQSLPFSDESFDVVIANHMLYHVANLPVALDALRRALRPGGRLFAATNGADHCDELTAHVRHFDPDSQYGNDNLIQRFCLENGMAILAPHFDPVVRHIYHDSLFVTEAAPLAAYVGSMLREGWEFTQERLAEFERFVEAEIAKTGAIRVRKSQGMFEAVRQ